MGIALFANNTLQRSSIQAKRSLYTSTEQSRSNGRRYNFYILQDHLSAPSIARWFRSRSNSPSAWEARAVFWRIRAVKSITDSLNQAIMASEAPAAEEVGAVDDL